MKRAKPNPYAEEFERALRDGFNNNMLLDTASVRQVFALGAAFALDRLGMMDGPEGELVESFYEMAQKKGRQATAYHKAFVAEMEQKRIEADARIAEIGFDAWTEEMATEIRALRRRH
jgi:hypothetical protein